MWCMAASSVAMSYIWTDTAVVTRSHGAVANGWTPPSLAPAYCTAPNLEMGFSALSTERSRKLFQYYYWASQPLQFWIFLHCTKSPYRICFFRKIACTPKISRDPHIVYIFLKFRFLIFLKRLRRTENFVDYLAHSSCLLFKFTTADFSSQISKFIRLNRTFR